jgi:Flp pilus assembly protein TadG
MSGLSFIRRFNLAAHRFGAAREANIAVTFAIAILPILGFVGAAIDYSRAANARSSMQAALDSTSLMLSKDLSTGTITQSDISTKAVSYFNALYTNKDAQDVSITAIYTPGSGTTGSSVKVDGSGSIVTDFMKVAGFPTMGYNATSTSTWGTSLLRVALVLDNTGSMNDFNKIGALRSAATNLVTQLSGLAVNNGDVYISVIPFSVDVNVGTSNVNASWLRWDLWDPTSNQCSGGFSLLSFLFGGMTMEQCLGHGYTWNHTVGTPSHSTWNGCVGDRDQSYDVTSTAPSSTATNFPADQYGACPVAQILPLTYSWTNVNSTINQMTANGTTNQTIGLLWGWLSLLQQSPLSAPAENSTSQYQHIIILFTDGLNTQNRWSDSQSAIDARMSAVCTNAKNSGVTIYTVQIDTDGAGQSAVLPGCASNAGNFFMLTQPSQIATAFSQIGTQIAKLRVAR